MAHEAFTQFIKDIPRINLWVDGGFVFPDHQSAPLLLERFFKAMPPCLAWRVIDVLSQGTLATWFESAQDTYARGTNEHLVARGRQRIDVDTVLGIVRIEKEFAVVTLERDQEIFHPPKRLYLEFDCRGRRPVRSAWQHDLRDGILIRPFSGEPNG